MASQQKVPIVYSPQYNISFMGMEKLHPFDSRKFGKIYEHLREFGGFQLPHFYAPEPVSDELLLEVHYPSYLDSLSFSEKIASIAEMTPLRLLPSSLLHRQLLLPMRYATGGTLLATELALHHGWAINLGGGFHHAKAGGGEGFCFFADIPLAIRQLWKENPKLRVLVIDFDAHQGNGVQSILEAEPHWAMLDLYNADIYPQDTEALSFIRYPYPVPSGIGDKAYLDRVAEAVPAAIDDFQPDLIIYNAGTDPYEEDALGQMQVSEAALILRDQYVFETAFDRKVPIAMLLSGGYSRQSGMIAARSIHNLIHLILKLEGISLFH